MMKNNATVEYLVTYTNQNNFTRINIFLAFMTVIRSQDAILCLPVCQSICFFDDLNVLFF